LDTAITWSSEYGGATTFNALIPRSIYCPEIFKIYENRLLDLPMGR
jgi:hypothetical protein